MRLEPLRLAPRQVDGGVDGRQPYGDDGNKTARLPRWTREEILLLIQGKRVVENRVRGGRGSGSGQMEPKWASVSSYCKRNGMNRGPVQCRKRWSNLAGDFRKIKDWEGSIKDETESFWKMRNDLRRERKLPGLFDKEVYDILDGGGGLDDVDEEVGDGLDLGLAPAAVALEAESGEEAEAEAAVLNHDLFLDFEQSAQEESGRSPVQSKETPFKHTPASILISVTEKEHEPYPKKSRGQGSRDEEKKQTQSLPPAETTDQVPTTTQQEEGIRKRKTRRYGTEKGDDQDREEAATNLQHRLIEALDQNGKFLSSQMEAHNTHLQLDREQRNHQMTSLISVLNKLADSLGKIADKL